MSLIITLGRRLLAKTSSIVALNRRVNTFDNLFLRDEHKDTPSDEVSENAKCLNRLLNHYLKTLFEKKKMLKDQEEQFQIGRMHLARMLGIDAEFMDQRTIDKAIRYLFPSGLYVPQARPSMKPPTEVFYRFKEAQFGEIGRPYSFLFYTTKPNFYEILHKLGCALENADLRLSDSLADPTEDQIEQFKNDTSQVRVINREELCERLAEKISDLDYCRFRATFFRLLNHRHAPSFKDLITSLQMPKADPSCRLDIPPPKADENGRLYQTSIGTRRLSSAEVTVWADGTGKITIEHPSFNTKDILYFTRLKHRETVISPLLVTETLGLFDVHIKFGGVIGFSNEAFAARSGLAWSLASLVDEENVERLRLAGLLTKDIQLPERKMYGRAGARKRYKWRKR